MKIQSARQRLLASTIIGGAALLAMAAPAFAQDATEVEGVVVTGSRIVRQDFEAISPITTVGSEQLELTATLTVESLLNELPQIVPGNTRTSNNAGGEDFATIDLRGLGTQRTLVLINGERVPPSSTTGVVDLIAFLYICENEGLNITELAQLGRFTGATASRRARALAGPDAPSPRPPSLGLVEIYEGGDDARARQIFLTDKGRAARDAIAEMIAGAIPLALPAWRGDDPRERLSPG